MLAAGSIARESLLVVAATALAVAGSAATASAEPSSSTQAPTVISLPLNFAEQKQGIRIDAVDIGQHLVDGVSHQRGIYDRGNWRIVAQCEQMVGKTLKAGVIKDSELKVIQQAKQGASIANNTFRGLLDCP
ncbi:hypothetical protein [Mycolicibacter minnesotensis]